MAYFRKRYNRYRRGKKPLSNYNIATKTGRKSQAKQIYYLKKRINKIQRLTKPEIVTLQRSGQQIELKSSMGYFGWIVNTNNEGLPEITPVLGPQESNVLGQVTAYPPNNFARLQSFRLYGNMRYALSNSTPAPVTLRIVIVQMKTTRGGDFGANDVFTSGYKNLDYFSSTFGPLQTGLARSCKVLSDKRYVLSSARPSVNIRTNLRYLMNFYRDNNNSSVGGSGSESTGKGVIYVLYSIYSASNQTDTIGYLDYMCKLAYTDA